MIAELEKETEAVESYLRAAAKLLQKLNADNNFSYCMDGEKDLCATAELIQIERHLNKSRDGFIQIGTDALGDVGSQEPTP